MDQDVLVSSRAHRRRRRGLAFMLVALAVASISASAYSLALFTSSVAQGSNNFTTGTGTLTLTNGTGATIFPFNVTGMMPGDNKVAAVAVNNTGNATMRYSVTATATNPDTKSLASQLQVTVKGQDATTGTRPCGSFDGTVLQSPATPVTLSSAATVNVLGDPTAGAQAGDQTVAGSGNQQLCIGVALPIGTTSSYQGATTTVTFNFAGEQTANNP